ncbi:hypothetical protein [Enterococcus sp. DIV0876]|uniref:hypothetical protein n=1 Tax=Enterococcus sp. DIV0876 TaxID=2774633 RepID=UPI003D2FA38D
MKATPWYKKKKVYLPIAFLLGVIGFVPSLVSLFGASIDDELNANYYQDPHQDITRKKNKP